MNAACGAGNAESALDGAAASTSAEGDGSATAAGSTPAGAESDSAFCIPHCAFKSAMQMFFEVVGVERVARHNRATLALDQAGAAQAKEDLLVGAGARAQDAA